MKFITTEEAKRLRARVDQPSFSEAAVKLRREADEAMKTPIIPPTIGGGWEHDYFCPDHATRLEWRMDSPHAHRCAVDGRLFSGDPYDAAWRQTLNHRLRAAVEQCAIGYLAFGQASYAAKARDILLAYAELYPTYEVHGLHAGKGRATGQSLSEAVWVIGLAHGYDAITETLSPAQREKIESSLFRPAADHLMTQLWRRTHNIECWHLGGVATLGVLLGDDRYIEPVFAADFGYQGQIDAGVLEDGWWWEGSPGYHWYALDALLSIVRGLRLAREEVLKAPRLQRMFDAPMELARCDGSLPATNDGWISVAQAGSLQKQAAKYELACGLFGAAHYEPLLAEFYKHVKRDSFEALLHGPEVLPESNPPKRLSVVQRASGYAVLRQGEPCERERWLMMKFGPHGGGHGHPDKLSLDLHAFGENLAGDLGTPGYGIPMNKSWYRTTVAHNTFTIDGANQPEREGELVRFRPAGEGDFGIAHARVEWPADKSVYSGVTAERCVLWKPSDSPYFIDIVRVSCPQPRQIDLAWHHAGELEMAGLSGFEGALEGAGYEHLRELRSGKAREYQAQWKTGEVGTRCMGMQPAGGTLMAARSPANPASESRSTLLRRVTAKEAWFVAVFEPFTGLPSARNVRWLATDPAAGPIAFTIEREGEHHGWIIGTGAGDDFDPSEFHGAKVHRYEMAKVLFP